MVINNGCLPLFFQLDDSMIKQQIGKVNIVCEEGLIYGELLMDAKHQAIMNKILSGGRSNGL